MNVEDMIRDANPVNPANLPGADAPEARWLLHGILQVPAAEHRPARRRRRPRGLVLSVAAGAAAAAAGATALAVGLLSGPAGTALPGASSGPPSAATVAALHKLSLVAARQPSAGPPGPGQFQYTSSVGINQSCTVAKHLYYCVNFRERREIWIGHDGSGRIRETETDPVFPTAKDRQQWLAMGKTAPPLVGPPSDERFGPGKLVDGPVDLSKLPTDPAQLAKLISSRKIEGGPPGPAEDFVQIGDLLRESDASPELRAALFKVAAGIPGVKLLGTVTDSDGRSGTAIAFPHSRADEPSPMASPVPASSSGNSAAPSPAPSASSSPSDSGSPPAPSDSASPSPSASASPGPGDGSQGTVLDELIFDPETSGLLAEQTVLVRPDGSTKLQLYYDYLLSGVVDSVNDVPPSSSVP
jgi:hypothetical protein